MANNLFEKMLLDELSHIHVSAELKNRIRQKARRKKRPVFRIAASFACAAACLCACFAFLFRAPAPDKTAAGPLSQPVSVQSDAVSPAATEEPAAERASGTIEALPTPEENTAYEDGFWFSHEVDYAHPLCMLTLTYNPMVRFIDEADFPSDLSGMGADLITLNDLMGAVSPVLSEEQIDTMLRIQSSREKLGLTFICMVANSSFEKYGLVENRLEFSSAGSFVRSCMVEEIAQGQYDQVNYSVSFMRVSVYAKDDTHLYYVTSPVKLASVQTAQDGIVHAQLREDGDAQTYNYTVELPSDSQLLSRAADSAAWGFNQVWLGDKIIVMATDYEKVFPSAQDGASEITQNDGFCVEYRTEDGIFSQNFDDLALAVLTNPPVEHTYGWVFSQDMLAADDTVIFPNGETFVLQEGVFYTENGNFCHLLPNCSGMKNASLHTMAEAQAAGKPVCETCADADSEYVILCARGQEQYAGEIAAIVSFPEYAQPIVESEAVSYVDAALSGAIAENFGGAEAENAADAD